MKTHALLIVAGLATAANGEAFFEIVLERDLVDPQAGDTVVDVSLWLDANGSSNGFYSSFTGWAGFTGVFRSNGGDWLLPAEDDGDAVGGDWDGRRPRAFNGPPVNTAGSFRNPPAAYETNGGVLRFAGGDDLDALVRGAALGGFSQDSGSRLEVFRTQIDFADVSGGVYEISFEATSLAVAIDSGFNTTRFVTDDTIGSSATLFIPPIPAPGSLAALLLTCIGVRRQR